ncbi:hypothetical protein [Streptomyces tendae]|uniref:hypothetical protein n=1 Tax=Streptomyces tendae TaxID=1932 RepID=UPI003D74545C
MGAQEVVRRRVLGACRQAQQVGRQLGASGGGALEQRVGGGRGPAHDLGVGEPVPHPPHAVARVEAPGREVDGRTPPLVRLGPKGDGEPYGFVGIRGEPLDEVGGQRRVLGEEGQVRPLGDALHGVVGRAGACGTREWIVHLGSVLRELSEPWGKDRL